MYDSERFEISKMIGRHTHTLSLSLTLTLTHSFTPFVPPLPLSPLLLLVLPVRLAAPAAIGAYVRRVRAVSRATPPWTSQMNCFLRGAGGVSIPDCSPLWQILSKRLHGMARGLT